MTRLEQLLKDVENVKTLTEEQSKETLKSVLATETARFLKESSEKEEDIVEEKVNEDYSEEVVGGEENSVDGDVDTGLSDLPNDAETVPDLPVTPDDDFLPADNTTTDVVGADEELDLSNASFEEVLEALKNLPDDTVIQVKKNAPTFDVDTSISDDDGDLTFDVNSLDEEECDNCFNEEKVLEWLDEDNSINEDVINEYKKIISQYENKLSKLEEQLAQSNKTVKALKEQEEKYEKVLTESQNVLQTLAVNNTNLMHMAKIFTEQTLSKDEKVSVLKQFDSVKTINESKILFEALNSGLIKSTPIIKEEIKKMKEEIKGQKKEILKEEKTFIDPEMEKFNRLLKHKI